MRWRDRLLLLGLLAASACSDTSGASDVARDSGDAEADNGRLIVVGNRMFAPGGNCAISDDAPAFLQLGILDVALDRPYGYKLLPQVAYVPPASDANADFASVTGSSIRIEGPPGIDFAWPASCPADGFDGFSNGRIVPGEREVFSVEGIRSCQTLHLRQLFQSGKLSPGFADQVIVKVILQMKGRRDDAPIISAPFEFPVRVCYGCLQTGYPDPAYKPYEFPKVPPCESVPNNPYRGNPCGIAQDLGPILCCYRDAARTSLRCPA
jgi:hypothetical protein